MEPPVPVYTHRIPPYCFKTAPSSPAATPLSCFSSSRAIHHLKLLPHHLFSQFSPQKHTTSHSKFLQEAGPHAKELCPSTSQLPAVSPACADGEHSTRPSTSTPKGGAHRSPQHPGFPAHSPWAQGVQLQPGPSVQLLPQQSLH